MKGYIIVFYCKEVNVITKSKIFPIQEGYYAYVGSCGLYCDKRISRHFSKEKRKKHWHIDYLSELCEPLFAIILPLQEKEIAKLLLEFDYVKGFGSTDDNENPSHLFRVSLISLLNLIRGIRE
ncbi:DUF123 domain-containing protein [Sulfolobus sp. S-194]|uniref:GIY-YIG nuclease family protein n=1 Tax=Sulfolobus sp. S-194 TaxID=2512240 RepID=UPI0014371268|nr:DUF123 domain-containing protein [Sulfolobus sp. S-194]QIW24009.1 DUF123 domain-containing protein [Sulfolobus sp. S-194]